jgi:hypothetical protein
MNTPDYITKTNKQTPAVKSLILEAQSDTTAIVELMDELEGLSPEEARKLVGPLVEQFYALQFKLGGVLGAISKTSRTPELTVELLMEVDYPPIPIEVSQLEDAYRAIAGGWDVDIAQLRRLGWSKLRHMGEYLTQDNIKEVVQLAEENDYHPFVKKVHYWREKGRKEQEAQMAGYMKYHLEQKKAEEHLLREVDTTA